MEEFIEQLFKLASSNDTHPVDPWQFEFIQQIRLEFFPPELVGAPRSPHWPAFQKAWLIDNPTCAACGGTKCLQVHHVKPYHLHPNLELSRDNVITLCQAPAHNCHFVHGHLLNWSSWNVDVREDAAAYLKKVRGRP